VGREFESRPPRQLSAEPHSAGNAINGSILIVRRTGTNDEWSATKSHQHAGQPRDHSDCLVLVFVWIVLSELRVHARDSREIICMSPAEPSVASTYGKGISEFQ